MNLRRRTFLRSVGWLGASIAGVGVLDACGQLPWSVPTRLPRIGYLSPGPREARADFVDAFLQGLRDLGYIDGQTIAIDWRFSPEGGDARLPELAAELVALPVDVLVASNSMGASAAGHATSTIPIVAANMARPVENGLVASLARPGANLTGTSTAPAGIEGRRLELLRDVAPGITRVGVLFDATSPTSVTGWDEIRRVTEQAGVYAERINLRSADDLETALAAAALSRADAIMDAQFPLLLPVRARLAELALQHRLPAITGVRAYIPAGLLMSFGPDQPAIYRRAAVYVDKILKGAKPADLPIEQPTTFELLINVKTLQALALTIPPTVLPLVTEWVQ